MKSRFNKETIQARAEAGKRIHENNMFRIEMVNAGVPSKTVRELWKEGKTNEEIRKIVLA